jgi:Transposase DDE domain
MKKQYPSDINREQFAEIEWLLLSARKKTKPRRIDLSEDELSLLEQALKNQVEQARISDDREAETTFLIVDAQSARNTDTAIEKGYDAGEKVSGIKRHIAVDTEGLPHAICVTTADVTDRKGALQALTLRRKSLSRVVSVLGYSGYTGQPFADGVSDILGASVQIAKRNDGWWNDIEILVFTGQLM